MIYMFLTQVGMQHNHLQILQPLQLHSQQLQLRQLLKQIRKNKTNLNLQHKKLKTNLRTKLQNLKMKSMDQSPISIRITLEVEAEGDQGATFLHSEVCHLS